MTTTFRQGAAELLNRALRKHFTLPLRSEQLDALPELYVAPNLPPIVDAPDWQVIFGRRGAGKTALLNFVCDCATATIEQSRIVAVYITAQDCLVPHGHPLSDEAAAKIAFRRFLQHLTNRLGKHVERLLGEETFMQRLTGERRLIVDRVESLVRVAPTSR